MDREERQAGDWGRALFLWGILLCGAVLLALVAGKEFSGRKQAFVPQHASRVEDVETALDSRPASPSRIPLEDMKVFFWNVRNYIVENDSTGERPKPADQRDMVADVLAELQPDIVVLAEAGADGTLADLTKRLSKRGIKYDYTKVHVRKTARNGLILLSKYPIERDASRSEVPVEAVAEEFMLRGILDVVIRQEPGGRFRIVAAHLKSKFGEQEYSDRIRRAEAAALRGHLDSAVTEAPEMPVILCGDLNDSPESPALRTIMGNRQRSPYFKVLKALDKNGESWTYFYEKEDVFSRIDYMSLYGEKLLMNKVHAFIPDNHSMKKASDHRGVMMEFKKH